MYISASTSGQTWQLAIDDTTGLNPLSGLAITAIAVETMPSVTNNIIYVATADRAIDTQGPNGLPLVNAVGIWRYNPNGGGAGIATWANITFASFPTTVTNFTWSDLYYDQINGKLVAAAGANSGDPSIASNGVYTCANPAAALPVWSINNFPADPGPGTNESIKLAGFDTTGLNTTIVAFAADSSNNGLVNYGGVIQIAVQISNNDGAT